MRVLHVSDTHGRFPDLPLDRESGAHDRVEVIVHSGDLLPNISWGQREVETTFQPHWAAEKEGAFDLWRAGLPVIFCAGNHDFVSPCWDGLLDCTNKIVEFGGLRFYGFPYVPACGSWNWNCNPAELRARFDPVAKMVDRGEIDVLVPHCPPWGVLDLAPGHYDRHPGGEHIGNPALAYYLRHWKKKPRAILCGHVHEAHGTETREGVFVSNAATTMRVVEI